MAQLKITRDKGWADKLRSYKIIVDEKEIAEIKEGETVELDIDQGQHELYCMIAWCRSNKLTFDVNSLNEIKAFEVKSSLRGVKLLLCILYSSILRNSYLRLIEK